jgi:hypothetical protein
VPLSPSLPFPLLRPHRENEKTERERERERGKGNEATVASGIKLCLDRRYEGARSTEVDDPKRRNGDRHKTTASEKCCRQRKLQNHKKQTVSRRRRRRFSRPPRHTKKMPRPLTKLSAKPEHQNSFHRTSKRNKERKKKGPSRCHQLPHRNYKRKQKRRYDQKRTYSNEEEESKEESAGER